MPHSCTFSGTCKLVVSDADFTLLGSDKSISPANVQALNDLRDAGIPFAFATGRYWHSIVAITDGIFQLTSPQVLDNGSTVFLPETQTIAVSHTIAAETADFFYNGLQQGGFFPNVCLPLEYFMENMDDVMAYQLKIHNETATIVDSRRMKTLLPQSCKIAIYGREEDAPRMNALTTELEAEATRLGLPFHGVYTEKAIYVVTAPGVNKLSGIRDACNIIGCELNDVAAIGDGDNDVEMLAGCGLGFAVGNATARAKDAASHVVDTCDRAGFAQAIRQILQR